MKLGRRHAMGCGCRGPRRPNVNDRGNLRAVVTPPATFIWVVGENTYTDLYEAKTYADANNLTVIRRKA